MRKDRRTLLAGLAVGVAGAGGLAWWAFEDGGLFRIESAGPHGAWRAWRGRPDEPMLNLVRAGILAANPSNAQPWLFRLSHDRIEIFADPERAAGTLDPYFREVHLGLGCAIENMVLAAPANGLAIDIRYAQGRLGATMPIGISAGPAAVLILKRQSAPVSPLFDAIPLRHTNRGPFDPERAVPDEAVRAFEAMAKQDGVSIIWLTDPDRRTQFKALLVQSTRTILKHPTLVAAGQRWLRPADVAKKSRDGVPIGTPLADFGSAWVEDTDMQVTSAPLIGVLAIDDPYDLAGIVRVGRVWQRLNLDMARRGLAGQPLDQILWRMEYEENLTAQSTTAPAVYNLLPRGDLRPAMFFRAGYAKTAADATARRPLDEVVLATG